MVLLVLVERARETMTAPRYTLTMSDYNIVYPELRHVVTMISSLTLQQRGMLIKCCQAQRLPHFIHDGDTLYSLLCSLPPLPWKGTDIDIMDLFNVFPLPDWPSHYIFPILLDLLRGVPFRDATELDRASSASWSSEISLCEKQSSPDEELSYDVFFSSDHIGTSLHPQLPPIPLEFLNVLRRRFRMFRASLVDKTVFSRYTHKNMSRSTRRDAESQGIDLQDVPIFGQDDWIRHYHRTGVRLEGVCEMRQRFYPSSAKPRTYFAMGGTVYHHCRFLSDILIDLVDILLPTNRRWKLNVDRLEPMDYDHVPPEYYQVYDLSSFTSNFTNQRPLIRSLQKFFEGVPVQVIDEYHGPTYRDLGEMLSDYGDFCSEYPVVSYERCGYPDDATFPHGSGSLLGIFGNMSLATLAHCLIMFTVNPSESTLDIAGDDAILRTDGANSADFWKAVSLVGHCAVDKTFESTEDSCVFLKRPLLTQNNRLTLAHAIIPPCVASTFLNLSDDHTDPRYRTFPSYRNKRDRISVVGSDLLRFLSSGYIRKVGDVESMSRVYEGFSRLVHHHLNVWPMMSLPCSELGYFWPAHPESYDFDSIHPYHMLLIYQGARQQSVTRHERVLDDVHLFLEGQTFVGNMTKGRKLAETLGYLDCQEEKVELEGADLMHYWLAMYNVTVTPLPPAVYVFRVMEDPPEWLSSTMTI
jgi:hypothetical protein